MNSGRLVILIDDVDPANSEHVSVLRQLGISYPKARYIVAAKMPNLPGDHFLPVVGIEGFTFVQVMSLNRGRVRMFVKKWRELDGTTVDHLVEEITARFNALGIPLTASYVAIYLAILQEDRGYSPINTSSVLEHFIEDVLDKYKPGYKFRTAFDYRNQLAYLSRIAEKMCRDNRFIVGYDTVYQWSKEYFAEVGIEQDIPIIIEFFFKNGLLQYNGSDVSFRYNLFLSFFVAIGMQQRVEFRDWVFSAPNYANYVNEIDIYCGLTRNDLKAIEFLGDEFGKHSLALEKLVEPLRWKDRLENLKLPPTNKSEAEFTDLIARQLSSPRI